MPAILLELIKKSEELRQNNGVIPKSKYKLFSLFFINIVCHVYNAVDIKVFTT